MNVKIIFASYLRRKDFNMATPNKIAPQFPLQIDEDSGAYNEYGLEDLTKVINQNLKMVLLTSPGERLMYPNFGVFSVGLIFNSFKSFWVHRISCIVCHVTHIDNKTNPLKKDLPLRKKRYHRFLGWMIFSPSGWLSHI